MGTKKNSQAKVASDKQIQANRRNALASTGPRSTSGKAASRGNAATHGLLAEHIVLLPHEDEAEFTAYLGGLREALEPIGQLEELLVDQIAGYGWRLRRLMRIEKGIHLHGLLAEFARHGRAEGPFNVAHPGLLEETFGGDSEPEELGATIDLGVVAAETILLSDEARLAEAFLRRTSPSEALLKLARYEGHTQRLMLKLLAELRSRQEARR
jgi:hypothetical protein